MAKTNTANVPVSKGCMNAESVGAHWLLVAIAHHFGNAGVSGVADAIDQARAANVPWTSIFQVVLGLLLQLFQGQSISLQQIIDAILKLIGGGAQPGGPAIQPAP